MVQPVIRSNPSSQRSFLDFCCQKLRALANAIKRIAIRIFYFFFPCVFLFRSYETSSRLRLKELRANVEKASANLEKANAELQKVKERNSFSETLKRFEEHLKIGEEQAAIEFLKETYLKNPKTLEMRSYLNEPPIQLATWYMCLEATDFILDKAPKTTELVGYLGQTALHTSLYRYRIYYSQLGQRVTRLLLQKSSPASLKLSDINGQTVLHFSVIYNRDFLFAIYKLYPPAADQRDKDGNTPLDLLREIDLNAYNTLQAMHDKYKARLTFACQCHFRKKEDGSALERSFYKYPQLFEPNLVPLILQFV